MSRRDRHGYLLGLRYGITPETYDRLLEEQGGVCAICLRPPSRETGAGTRVLRLGVDHDHRTGRIRGLLCTSCNGALGRLGDTVESIKRVLAYLEDDVRDAMKFIEETFLEEDER